MEGCKLFLSQSSKSLFYQPCSWVPQPLRGSWPLCFLSFSPLPPGCAQTASPERPSENVWAVKSQTQSYDSWSAGSAEFLPPGAVSDISVAAPWGKGQDTGWVTELCGIKALKLMYWNILQHHQGKFIKVPSTSKSEILSPMSHSQTPRAWHTAQGIFGN